MFEKPTINPYRFDSKRSVEKINIVNQSIESMTSKMVSAFNDPQGRGFYITVARDHSEFEIDKAIALALKYGRNPAAYFNSLMRKTKDSN